MSEFTRKRGGCSTFYAQSMGSNRGRSGFDIGVDVVREVTMSEDLSEVRDRRLRAIRVSLDTDRRADDRNEPVDLDLSDAMFLRDCLHSAIDAVQNDKALDR